MKYSFIFCAYSLIWLFSNSVFAQKTKLDSLYQKFNTSKIDSQKVNILNNIYAIHNKAKQNDSAIYTAKKAFELAKNSNYDAGLAQSCGNLAEILRDVSKYNDALIYGLQALELRRKIGEKKDIAFALYRLGLLYKSRDEYEKSIHSHQQALALAIEINDKKQQANIYNNIGLSYHSQGNEKEAMNSYLNCIKIREAQGDKAGLAIVYGNLSSIYYVQQNYDKALMYNQKSLALRATTNLSGKMISNSSLGIIYAGLKNYDKAVEHYQIALALSIELKEDANKATVLGNLGTAYLNLEDTAKSIKHYRESLAIKKEIKDKRGEAIILISIGEFYIKSKQYAQALSYLEQAKEIIMPIGAKKYILTLMEGLAKCYAAQKNYEKAFEYHKISATYKDSLFNENDAKKMQSLEFGYEMDKKQQEILLLQKDKDLQDAENNSKQQEILLLTQQQNLKTKELQLLSQERKTQAIEAEKQQQAIVLLNKDKEIQGTALVVLNQEKALKETQITLLNQQKIIQEEDAQVQKLVGFILFGGMIFLVLLAVMFYKSKQNTQQANVALSAKNIQIEQQRIEILNKNGEMKQINEEIHATLDLVADKNKELDKKNKDIIASITYAKRIQEAMLPLEEEITKGFGKDNFFILFKPRDIVSGDFYWFEEIPASFNATNSNPLLIMAVGDCTGHGIPGAFMSMIGNEVLNQVINIDKITSPDTILTQLSLGICYALKQDVSENRDGMDISIVAIDKTAKVFEYAGAMNSMFIFVNGELNLVETKNTIKHQIHNSSELISLENLDFWELKGNKIPIGGKSIAKNESFSKQTIPYIENETTLYLLSDGYQDQFGGKEARKFMVKKLRELLISIQNLDLISQQIVLDNIVIEWIAEGKQQQTDDITVVGIRI